MEVERLKQHAERPSRKTALDCGCKLDFGDDDHDGIIAATNGDDHPTGLYANRDGRHSKLLSGHLLAGGLCIFRSQSFDGIEERQRNLARKSLIDHLHELLPRTADAHKCGDRREMF